MKNNAHKRLVFAAVYAALTYVATFAIHIPIGANGGYINAGDAFVILSGTIIGGAYGAIAAGIGCALADLSLGYAVYIPATFFIKAMMAFAVSLIIRHTKRSGKAFFAVFLAAGLIAEAIMIAGYFAFAVLLYGLPAAIVSAPMNCIQGIGGIVLAVFLKTPMMKSGKFD